MDGLGLEELLKIKALNYFSPNETIEEIQTADLKYLLTDYYISGHYIRVFDNNRLENLKKAQECLKSLFETLLLFGFPVDNHLPEDPVARRQDKIARLMRTRELDGKWPDGLKQTSDDEIARAYWLDRIEMVGLMAVDELYMIEQEIQLLSHKGWSESSQQKQIITAPNTKVSAPFILTSKRAEVQEKVFRPFHNLPTMTIDEYLEIERQRGNIINGTGETVKRDHETDADFDAETEKLRARDERWDWITRGSGNRYNRS